MNKKQESGISATIIADSKDCRGNRITTAILVLPRVVLSEFNTHRMFSRNSASSRAIPFKKMVKMIKEDPFIPIKWMKDHTGMQGNEYFTGNFKIRVLILLWLFARNMSILVAKSLSALGLTKQIVNRLLEPWMWHTVLCTSCEWENFLSLRAEKSAEIHIQELAYKLLKAMNQSNPVLLQPGEWHIPFKPNFSSFTENSIIGLSHGNYKVNDETRLKIATANCARTSYNNFSVTNSHYGKDIELHDRLAKSGHWSPFEHSARVMTDKEYNMSVKGIKNAKSPNPANKFPIFPPEAFGWSGNFKGFIQYRKTFEGENKKDTRLIKK